VYGAIRRSLSQATLAFLLGALLMPVGLFDHPWWLLGIALVPMNLMCTPTLAANAEAISKLAPADVRGEVMGLQETATRLGLALGAPVVGFVADHSSSTWAFVTAGLGGVLVAVVRFVVERTRRASNDVQPTMAESNLSV
jgi:predicted MFS family arabinose efflux permease